MRVFGLQTLVTYACMGIHEGTRLHVGMQGVCGLQQQAWLSMPT